MKKVFYTVMVISLTTSIHSKGQAKKSDKNENNKDMEKQIFIDQFFIPKNSVTEFTERMNYNRNFIKGLPGFIKDEVYQKADEEGNVTVITIATWENAEYLNQAKSAVQAEYKRMGFDPEEFTRRLGIKMERGLYREMK